MKSLKVNLDAGQLREEKLDGRDYLVAPIVMINVGVHNRALYTEEDLKKSEVTWDDVPITINHPTDNGQPCTAKQPKVLEASIGRIFHANFTDSKMKAEAWFDVEKTKTLDSRILDRLNEKKVMEVSTGHFSDDEQTAGTFNGEQYREICRNIVGNHLAVLPDGTGACSVEDGAGCPRVNQKQEAEPMAEEDKTVLGKLKSLMKHVTSALKINEDSAREVYDKLWNALYAEIPGVSPWIVDVYDTWFVYERREENGEYTLWKRGYSIEGTKAVLADDAVQVVAKREYVPVPKGNKEKGNESMETPVKTNEAAPAAAVAAPKVETPAAPAAPAPKTLSEADVEKIVNDRVAKVLADQAVAATVKRIVANKANKVPEAALKVMSAAELDEYEKTLVPADGDFSILGAAHSNAATASSAPEMPKILMAEVK